MLDEKTQDTVGKVESSNRSETAMADYAQTIKQRIRALTKSPSFALISVITLALGIGCTTATFSLVNIVLLHSLPVADPDRQYIIWQRSPSGEDNVASAADFLDWKNQSRTFQDMAAYTSSSVNVTGVGKPFHVQSGLATANLFSLLGIKPLLGRTFYSDEDRTGGAKVVLLSQQLWHQQFGGLSNIVGSVLTLNGEPFTVIGVMPPQVRRIFQDDELWTPLQLDPARVDRSFHNLIVFGRGRDGITRQQCQTEMEVIARQLAQSYPKSSTGWGIAVASLDQVLVDRKLHETVIMFFGATMLMLFTACVNVAALFLVRTVVNRGEIGIRVALGATKWHLLQLIGMENLVISLAGGFLGFLLALWIKDLFTKAVPSLNPYAYTSVPVDSTVLLLTLGLALTAFISAFFPVWRLPMTNPIESFLHSGRVAGVSSGTRLFLNAMLTVEIALAVVLMVGASLLTRTLLRLQQVSLGFNPKGVLTGELVLPSSRYSGADRLVNLYRELTQKLENIPGVSTVALGTRPPLAGWNVGMNFSVEGQITRSESERPLAHFQMISGNYFRTLGIPLVIGRDFTEQDSANAPPVVIINETLAHKYWPNSSPLGKHITTDSYPPDNSRVGPPATREIVGVINNVRIGDLNEKPAAEMYVPLMQSPWQDIWILLQTRGSSSALMSTVTRVVHETDADQPISKLQTMDQQLHESLAEPQIRVMLIGLFGISSLIIALVGLSGVIAYSVTQRSREFAIRSVLGATKGDIFGSVIRQVTSVILAGIIAGVLVALASTRIMASLLYGVGPKDIAAFSGAVVIVAAAAVAATLLPAYRATKTDPAVILRGE